jgi:hypothetical protein
LLCAESEKNVPVSDEDKLKPASSIKNSADAVILRNHLVKRKEEGRKVEKVENATDRQYMWHKKNLSLLTSLTSLHYIPKCILGAA